MIPNPVYVFNSADETGVHQLPNNAVILIKDGNSLKQVLKTSQGDLNEQSTAGDLLNDENVASPLSFTKIEIVTELHCAAFGDDGDSNQTTAVIDGLVGITREIIVEPSIINPRYTVQFFDKNGELFYSADYCFSNLNDTVAIMIEGGNVTIQVTNYAEQECNFNITLKYFKQ